MLALLTQTMPVPVWAILTFLMLMVAWQYAASKQVESVKELFAMYWRAQHGEEPPE